MHKQAKSMHALPGSPARSLDFSSPCILRIVFASVSERTAQSAAPRESREAVRQKP